MSEEDLTNQKEFVLNSEHTVECPEFTNTTLNIVIELSFWVGGVVNCILSVFGFLINIVSAYVLLTSPILKNTFNRLLSILLIIDNMCLFFIMVEVLSNKFEFRSQLYDIFHPYFFHPFRNITLTSSIFMTVAIAHERYRAIRYPLIHRQTRSSGRYRRMILTKYTLLVLLLATLINIPKFFEAELQWICNRNAISENISDTTSIQLQNR
jgi:hypothetical protein